MSERKVEYVDLTPTWSGLVPLYVEFLCFGSKEQKQFAQEELQKMARVADAYVKLNKKEN